MKDTNPFLGRATIKDNAALINPNTLVSITEVKPLNILGLSKDEKIELYFQYQYFLRHLTYPIQIILRFVNKDSEKFFHLKRMANVEEAIKKDHKKNSKDILTESDEFRKWLKYFLELSVRPMLLCYFVVPVYSDINLVKNETAYVQALQLLNQRTDDCISRLSSIRIKRNVKQNSKVGEWEHEQLSILQEKKALLALKMFSRKSKYYSLNSFMPINNGRKYVLDYIKRNSFDEITNEEEITLDLSRLNDKMISNLFDSYSMDFVVLNNEGSHRYISVKDLFGLWVRKV